MSAIRVRILMEIALMKITMKRKILLTLVAAVIALTGCSVRTSFIIPEGTKLIVNDVPLTSQEVEKYSTNPFPWRYTKGIPYRLEKDDKVVEEGNLKSTFRVSSIFWPPFSIIYWPMRFDGSYDLTKPNQKVRPDNYRGAVVSKGKNILITTTSIFEVNAIEGAKKEAEKYVKANGAKYVIIDGPTITYQGPDKKVKQDIDRDKSQDYKCVMTIELKK